MHQGIEAFKNFADKNKREKFVSAVKNLRSPDGSMWGGILTQVNDGHTQGIDCSNDYLVLTSNQKLVGYIALCKKKGSGKYIHISHITDKNWTHPGGIQVFEHKGDTWVVVPFERETYKGTDGVLPGLPRLVIESEIRFYLVKDDELREKKELRILRNGKKAGSVGIAKVEDEFILGVSYKDNAVDFYKGNLQDKFQYNCLLPYSEESPSYVNSFSLLYCDESLYIAGLGGEDMKSSDFIFVSKVSLGDTEASIGNSFTVGLKDTLRPDHWSDPSFRWAGNVLWSTKNNKLSVIAAERMFNGKPGNTEIVMLSTDI